MSGNHSVQVLGSAVLLQGEAVLFASELVSRGVRQARDVNGIEANPKIRALQQSLAVAAEKVRADFDALRHTEVLVAPPMSSSTRQVDVIGTRAAAEILGCSPRHVTRIARSLDGWSGRQGKGWTFSRAAVENYSAERTAK